MPHPLPTATPIHAMLGETRSAKREFDMIDWSQSPDVERIPGKVSGAWLVKGTRLPVWAIMNHADDYTPEEIATEIFEGVSADVVRRIIAFARTPAKAHV